MLKSKAEPTLSARPKVRTSLPHQTIKVAFEPLEKKSINFIDQDGNQKSISLISKEFNLTINCVNYYEPSFEEFNSISPMSMHNFIINCRKFESMLSTLVNLPYFRFWSVMTFNSDVLAAFDSYLCNASRSYRLHPVLKNNDIKSVLSNIHRSVFKILVRLFLSKESEKNYMTTAYHSQILKSVVDVSKILNLLQLFGYGSNSEILKLLLKDYVSYHREEFRKCLKPILEDISHLLNRYSESDLEINDEYLPQLYNLVTNVTDIIFSLNKLVVIEPQLSALYCGNELPESLISFYSKYFPIIEKKCDNLFRQNLIVENLFKYLKSQITLTQASALLLFHHILQNEFVKTINNSDNQTFDALINILNSVISQKRFCFDYFTRFSFEQEFHELMTNQELNEQLSIGDVLEYYKITLKTAISEYLNAIDKERNNEATHSNMNNLISMCYQPEPSAPIQSNEPSHDIRTDPEICSKEQMIREMFPDLGDGFVYKCLEHYDFDNEKVIDAILESNLPPHLDSLNRQLNKNDLLKARSAAVSEQNSARQTAKDKYDPTSTKDLQLSQIYIGKKDKISNVAANKSTIKEKTISLMEKIQDEEEEAKENVKTLIERGKLTVTDVQSNIEYLGLYDDEFDDTYENEDLSFDVQDETFDDEDQEVPPENKFKPNPAQSEVPSATPFRQPNEKFDNRVQYSKNQFYNKRNYNRKQTQSQPNNSAPPSQSQPNSHRGNQPSERTSENRPNAGSSAGASRGNGRNFRNNNQQTQNNANRNRNVRNNGSYNNNNQGAQNRRG